MYQYNSKCKIFRVKFYGKCYIIEIKNPSTYKQTVKVYEEEDSIFSMIVQLLSSLKKKFSFFN